GLEHPASREHRALRARGQCRDDAAARSRGVPVRLRPARRHRAVAPRQRDRVVAARSHRGGAAHRSRPLRVRRTRLGLGRGSLDDQGRDRRGGAGAGVDDSALRAVQLARRGRVCRQGSLRHAVRFRRPSGGEPVMRKIWLMVAVVVAGIMPASFAKAQTTATESQGEFRFDLEEADSHRGKGVEGYVYNSSPWRITNVRLRVQSVDGDGKVTNESSGWVVGDVKAGGRGYFYVPIPAHAASYRASVQSFDKVGLEASRPEAP